MAKLIVPLLFSMILIFQLTCDLPFSPDRRIYGSWNLFYSEGMDCTCRIPPAPGISINFDTTGIFSIYLYDSLLDTRIFTIASEETRFPFPETTSVVKFVDNPPGVSPFYWVCGVVTGQYEIHNDTLEIWYLTGMGGCTSKYSRAKSIPWRGRTP
jgi:hypothetical protein